MKTKRHKFARTEDGPFLAAWKARHPSVSGHQGCYELREIVNAIFYQNRTGCQWAYLPHDAEGVARPA